VSLANIREETLGIIQEVSGKVDLNRANILKYINNGYKAFVRDTNCIEDRIDITSVANQFEYSKADAANIAYIYRINEVRHIMSGVSEVGRPLTPLQGGYGGLPEDYSYGRPYHYWTRGMLSEDLTTNSAKRFGVWPIDSASGNTIRLHVNRMPAADLTSGSDAPEIPSAWHEAISFYAGMSIFRRYSHLNQNWHRKYLDLRAEYQELVNNYISNMSVEYTELQTITEI